MIEDTVEYLISKGKEVIFDAEHFFDGYKNNPEYAVEGLLAAAKVERLDVFADALVAGGRDRATPVSVIENGSMPGQRRLTSDLASVGADARDAGVRPRRSS